MPSVKKIASVLWRRLNAEGSDVCHLFRWDDGWSVAGTAVFMEEGAIAELHYEVKCDAKWITQSGFVRGSFGDRQLDLTLTVDAERQWQINGHSIRDTVGCVDLDLNFTPSTNLIQFRRLELAIGSRAEVPVAWLAIPEFRLQVLPQTMARIDAQTYDYAARTVGYAGLIKANELGVVLEYPELWTACYVQTFA